MKDGRREERKERGKEWMKKEQKMAENYFFQKKSISSCRMKDWKATILQITMK